MATKVESAFLEFIRDRASAHIDHAVLTIDGVDQTLPIHSTHHFTGQNEVTIKKYVYANDLQVEGTITEAKLLDSDGNVLIVVDGMNIISSSTGLLCLFEVRFMLEVGS